MNYQVYKIEINGIVRYIGHTKDIIKREYQHNYLLKKGYKKPLYDKIRELYPDGYRISLNPLEGFKYSKMVDAKRKEMQLILANYFIHCPLLMELYQKIPNISDR